MLGLLLSLRVLISSIVVFVLSSIIHAVLKFHDNDFAPLTPEQEKILSSLPHGNFYSPHKKNCKTEEVWQERCKKEPSVMIAVRSPKVSEPNSMGVHLLLWFLYVTGVSLVVAYVNTLAASNKSFILAFIVAFLAYWGAEPAKWIWYFSPAKHVAKQALDSFVYAIATAGIITLF